MLHFGDNLPVLEAMPAESVDLIYLDPPFNSNATYNLIYRTKAGTRSQAQIEAFEDTWQWSIEAEAAFNTVIHSHNTGAAELLRAMRGAVGDNNMMAYLAMMAVRLSELHRVLKQVGSLYLHCDPTASHYLKILLDGIFGPRRFRCEIVWKRSAAHNDTKQGRREYGHLHDIILFYTKSDAWTWNPQFTPYDPEYVASAYRHIEPGTGRRYQPCDMTGRGGTARGNPVYEVMGVRRAWCYSRENMDRRIAEGRVIQSRPGKVPREKRYLDEMPGIVLQDVWTDLPPLSSQAAERTGWQTQKPLALLERIIAASSNAGDVVLDPFCGCGTAVHAAQRLNRQWIGIDITHLAISVIEDRLREAFPAITYDVQGTPKDLEGARDLAVRDKYQFQWWAVARVNGKPYGGKKKGADGGIDGLIYFQADARTTERAIISVKGGGVNVAMVRDLKGVLAREKSPIGVLITLETPTGPMLKEAAASGFYRQDGQQYPRLQILTAEQILSGKRPAIPLAGTLVRSTPGQLDLRKEDTP
jgi:DNA modification methylase